MTWYTVRHYVTGPAGHLYVIQPTDADVPELHRTLLELNSSTCGAEDHATCLRYYAENPDCGPDTCGRPVLARRTLRILEKAYKETGFDTSLFRPPKGYTHPTRALECGPIRLYGLRFHKTLFVAGSAAAKYVPSIQDDKDVADDYYLAERARVALDKRLRALPNTSLDADDNPVLPRDDLGRCLLPDAVLHPFR